MMNIMTQKMIFQKNEENLFYLMKFVIKIKL